jgi:hypothetical protein
MKSIRGICLLVVVSVLSATVLWLKPALAQDRWYVGFVRNVLKVNGITAEISTPLDPLELSSSGISNWVSTRHSDGLGADWLQAGWRYFIGYSIPKQYWEVCYDCIGEDGWWFLEDRFATQNWGTVVDYWVLYDNSQWCAITAGLQRTCFSDLHPAPAEVQVMAEVHYDPMNPLNTTFNNVRFKDPADNVFKLSDGLGGYWSEDPPYDYYRSTFYYFHTYRWPVVQYIPDVLRE